MLAMIFGGGKDSVFTDSEWQFHLGEGGSAGRHVCSWSSGVIDEGRIDGTKISFRAGNTTYSGTVNGDRIELRKSLPEAIMAMFGGPPPSDNKPRPAIGPPDGSDPSIDMGALASGGVMPPIVLRRVKR
jgi:beta-galactosidase